MKPLKSPVWMWVGTPNAQAIADGCFRMNSQFSSGEWPLIGSHASVDGPVTMHTQAALDDFIGFKNRAHDVGGRKWWGFIGEKGREGTGEWI